MAKLVRTHDYLSIYCVKASIRSAVLIPLLSNTENWV